MPEFRTKQGQVVPRAKPGDMFDYRYRFDHNEAVWVIELVGASKTVTTKHLITCELDSESSSDGWMYCKAEFLTNGATCKPTQTRLHVDRCMLRLLRVYDQVVQMPLIEGVGSKIVRTG